MNKKQSKMLHTALYLIRYEYIKDTGGQWRALWEDNENNTNALILGILDALDEDNGLYKAIRHQRQYMPDKLMRLVDCYADYYIIDEEDKRPEIYELVQKFINEIDKNKYFSDGISLEKLDYLERYYITPMREVEY